MPPTDNQTPPLLQWEPAPIQPWLGANDVHLWRARLGNPCWMPRLRETLTVPEVLAAERIPGRSERRQFIASRGFLRIVLGCYLRIPPSQVPLIEHEERLRLAGPHDSLFFDLSQSEDLTLLAVSRERELGLNVESVRENLPFQEMAGHYFDPVETWSVLTSRSRDRAQKFFDLWTGMEAARRARSRFTTGLAVRQLLPAAGFSASLAVRSDASRLSCWDWQLAA